MSLQYQPNTYNSLRFVDQVGGNYLFRGGAPLKSFPDPNNPGQCIPDPDPNNSGNCLQVFDYAGLTRAIASAPNLPGVPPPPASQYYLVVIDLVHSNEASEIEPAINYFHTDEGKSQGQFNLWDTNGTSVCYFNTPQDQRGHMVETIDQWLGDPLVWRVATIRTWLEDATQVPSNGRPGVPIVIYVHCDGGCDRTGEMIAAYRLRYMNDAWSAVWGDQPCQRPMGCNNYRAVQWYAFWLNQTQGFKLQHIGVDGGCVDPHIIHRICSAPDGEYLP